MIRVVALTGATGFIGSAILNRLVDAGLRVQALIRPPISRLQTYDPSVVWNEGHLADDESLLRLLSGVDVVIHCAGTVRGAAPKDFNQTNVDGVARLVRATKKQHPTPRFLLISSLAAREPHLSFYAASKRQGEVVLADNAGSMPWLALRPPAVYGPGDREMAPLFRLAGFGLAPILGTGDNRFSLLYVDDLAEAVFKILCQPKMEHGKFELHDGQPQGYNWHEIIKIVSSLKGKRIRKLHVPLRLVQIISRINSKIATFFGYAPMFTPEKVREISHPRWVCDNTEFNGRTGWQPKIRLKEGLQHTFGWHAN